MAQPPAAAETGDGAGNLPVGLAAGALVLVGAGGWFVHRCRVTPRRAAPRAGNDMLREVHAERPEQQAVKDEVVIKYLRRGGF